MKMSVLKGPERGSLRSNATLKALRARLGAGGPTPLADNVSKRRSFSVPHLAPLYPAYGVVRGRAKRERAAC